MKYGSKEYVKISSVIEAQLDTKNIAPSYVNRLTDKYIDYADKIANQNSVGRKVVNGPFGGRDSQTQKVYSAEMAASSGLYEIPCKKARNKISQNIEYMDWKETERFFKKVKNSATYQKLCEKNIKSQYTSQKFYICTNPTLEKMQSTKNAGLATYGGVMKLNILSGTNRPTILHEFAHLCGNMNHDWSFRADYLKLCSMFIGKEFAKLTKKEYMKRKLKTTFFQKTPKTPEQWIISYQKMAMLRKAKRV